MKKTVVGLFALLSSSLVLAVDMAPNAPQVYVVKKGDTLWDISGHYLKNPWSWPEIWQANPQVENPHLIFPGDVLSLVYVDGQPRVTCTGGPCTGDSKMPDGTVKLTPQSRVLSVGEAIPTLPREIIEPFLRDAKVLNAADIDRMAYIVASEGEHVITGAGDNVYVRGANSDMKNYGFFRPGGEYRDPDSNELLGYEALYVGSGLKVREGDPSTFDVRKSTTELRPGDRAVPVDDVLVNPVFFPAPAPDSVKARIISVYGGVSQIGQYNVVVLSRGERDGLRSGHTMTIWTDGKMVQDTIGGKKTGEEKGFFARIGSWFTGDKSESIKLPDEQAGTLMVFRTFDRVSLALVMKAERGIHIGDLTTAPNR